MEKRIANPATIHLELLGQLKHGMIMNKKNLEEVPTEQGVYIVWLTETKKICMKVGIATPRRKDGLKGRLMLHFRSNLRNSVLARHLQSDIRLSKGFKLDFNKKEDRQEFIMEHLCFQVLPLSTFTELMLRDFEKFLETDSGLNPRYCKKIIERV